MFLFVVQWEYIASWVRPAQISTCWRKSRNKPRVLVIWIIWISPLQCSGAVLVDQRLVVRLQLLDVGHLRGLGVQIEFAAERKEKVQRQVTGKPGARAAEDKMPTWTPGPRAACSDLCGCTGACSLRGSARGRRNGSESCTSPEGQQRERERETWLLMSHFYDHFAAPVLFTSSGMEQLLNFITL